MDLHLQDQSSWRMLPEVRILDGRTPETLQAWWVPEGVAEQDLKLMNAVLRVVGRVPGEA